MYTMIYNKTTLRLRQTEEFSKWLKRLKDVNARARINLRLRRVELTGDFGDVKPVGEGVSEIRIDCGPGYRVYFAKHGKEIILLLIGGDKSTQKRDILRARKLNKEYE